MSTPIPGLVEALKEATREAREALSDLHQVRRELEELRRDAINDITKVHKKAIDEVMPEYMEDLGKAVKQACDVATEKVYKRFDTLADILMGEDDPNKESLAVVIRGWKTRRNL